MASIKAKVAKEIAERLKAGDDLAMDYASRMQRASEQGFSGDKAYRGIYGDYNPDKSGNYQMFTSSPEDAGEYGNNIIQAKLRKGRNLPVNGGGNNFNSIPVGQLPDEVRGGLHSSVGNVARTDDISYAAQQAGYDSVTFNNVYDNAGGEIPLKPKPKTDEPMSQELLDMLKEFDSSGLADDKYNISSPVDIPKNYDPVSVDVIFNPKNIRSVNAVFDPAKKGSSNLLASLGAGTAVAASLGMTPQDSYAESTDLASLLAMQGEPLSRDTVQGARPLGGLGRIADLIESADRNIDGPANMLVPTGTSEYIRKLQYGDDIGYMDRLFANPLL